MNILSIDTDYRLAMEPRATMGDSQSEAALWGTQVSRLWVIAFSWRHQKLQIKNISDNVTVYPTSSMSHLGLVADAFRLGQKICRANSIDVITTKDPFFTGLAGWLLKKKFHVPLNIRVHVNCLNNKLWLKERNCNILFNRLGYFLLNRADSILTVHPAIAAQIAKNLKNTKVRLFSLDNDVGIPVEKFDYADGTSVRKNLLRFPGQKMVLYAGRLAKEKNLENLLYAIPRILKHYPKTLFVILGEGPQEKNLRKMCQHLHIQERIVFHSPVPYDQMPHFIHASDLVVVPSNHEGGGARVMIEAILTGRPVVATDVGGITRHIIQNGKNGFIVRTNSPPDLAQALSKIINNPLSYTADEKFRNELRHRYDRKAIVPQIIAVWDKTRNS